MAKGVAAITMDEEYQQKRREAMNKQPSGLKEGLTRGGKGLVSVRVQTRGNLQKTTLIGSFSRLLRILSNARSEALSGCLLEWTAAPR